MRLCINCGIATDRCNTIGRHLLENASILSVVKEWITPRTVNDTDFICKMCYNNAIGVANKENISLEAPSGHRRVCTLCGRSLLRRIRCHQMNFGSAQHHKVIEVVNEWILPQTMSISSYLCHSCWMKATKASRHFQTGASTSAATSMSITHANTIDLPDYFRPIETESRCFVEGCHRSERNRLTLSLRKQLLKMYNYYVPKNNRLCDHHLICTSWDFLNDTKSNNINSFTANHIQDMLSLKETS